MLGGILASAIVAFSTLVAAQQGVLDFEDIDIPSGISTGPCGQYVLNTEGTNNTYHGFILTSSASNPRTVVSNVTETPVCREPPSGMGPWQAAVSGTNVLWPQGSELNMVSSDPFGLLAFYFTTNDEFELFRLDPDPLIILNCTGTRNGNLVVEQSFTWHMVDGWSKLFLRFDPGFSGLTGFRAVATYQYLDETNNTMSMEAEAYFDNIQYVF